METTTILLFGLIVFIAYFVEGLTGFGSAILAMPFVLMLTSLAIGRFTISLLGAFVSSYIILISYKDIIWKQYFRILLFVLPGIPLGMLLFEKLSESTMKKILTVFMIFVAIRGLYICYWKNSLGKPLHKYILNFLLFLGGCVHGAFTTGGPLVVVYASEAIPQKGNFRATLSMLWLTLSTIIVLQAISQNYISRQVLVLSVCTMPFVICGAILGNYAHHKIANAIFNKIVYFILLVAAIFMFTQF